MRVYPSTALVTLFTFFCMGCSSDGPTTAPGPSEPSKPTFTPHVPPPQEESSAIQARVSFIGDSGMQVSFQVLNPGECVGSVWYGTESNALNKEEREVTSRCTYISSGTHIHIKLKGLLPFTKYYYQLGLVDKDGKQCVNPKSTVNAFTTAKSAGDLSGYSVQVFGDMGYDKEVGFAKKSHDLMLSTKNEMDWYFHVGDIAYQDNAFLRLETGDDLNLKYEEIFNSYLTWMEPMTSKSAYMVLVGNHESECHSPYCLQVDEVRDGLSNFTAYNCRFKMPSEESKGVASMWYSFDYGGVHYVAMNSETDFPDAPLEEFGGCTFCEIPAGGFGGPDKGTYLRWLEADLKAAHANRDKVPWIVGLAHRPLHVAGGQDDIDECTKVESTSFCATHGKLIDDYTDIFISGHMHFYSRLTAHNAGNPLLVVPGGTGCDEWHERGLQEDLQGSTAKWKSYFAYGSGQSLGKLTVLNGSSTIEYEQFDSATGKLIDKIRIKKDLASPTTDNEIEVVDV